MSVRSSIISGIEIAATFSGVPYLGGAATILRSINDTCDKMALSKSKAKALKAKTGSLLILVDDQSAYIQDENLRVAADELRPVLEKVQKRVQKYSRYNFTQRFIRGNEVDQGLQQCITDIDTAMTDFKMKSTLRLHQKQDEAHEHARHSTAEIMELLHTIVHATAGEQQARLNELRTQPELATPLFGALQQRLRVIQDEEELARPSDDAMVVDHPMPGDRSMGIDRSMMIDRSMVGSPAPMSPRGFSGDSAASSYITMTPRRPPVDHSEEYHLTERIMRDLLGMGVASSIPRLDGQIVKVGDVAQAGGMYSDIWLGEWLSGQKVALKALRNVRPTESAIKRFERQVKVWIQLRHPHILSFYGLCADLMQNVSMVSAWQENGNVLKYVKEHPEADKLRLMRGAAEGLAYLHSGGIVHGNMKCANILVSFEREAQICDFGMSKIIEEVTDNSASATLTAGGSARWLSPELINGAESSPTRASDVYSFAMAVLECLTAKHPYGHCKRDANVIHEVITLQRFPPRPQGPGIDQWLSDDLWKLLEECWMTPHLRPSMADVVTRMSAMEEAARLASWN